MGSCSSVQSNTDHSPIQPNTQGFTEQNHASTRIEETKLIINRSKPRKDKTRVITQEAGQADQNSLKIYKRMTKDTYQFLKNLDLKGHPMMDLVKELVKCYEGETFFNVPGKASFYYFIHLAELVQITFKNMCYSTQPQDKTRWRTRMLNILELTYSTHLGEKGFEYIPKRANTLKAEFPVTEKIQDNNIKVDIKDFDDVTQKKLYLTSFFPFDNKDLVFSKEDYEFEFQYGENVSVPSEREATKKVLLRAKDLKEAYSKDIGDILAAYGGQHFKCGSKSYLRTEAKLNELVAEKKSRPVFNHLFDTLRCKAHFMNPEDLKKAYDAIFNKFQIIRLKNKLNTHLKNMTFNLVYKELITEVQLVLGEPQAESENHILYEIERTHSIQELYEVVEGWGGFDYSSFEPIKGEIVEIEKLEVREKWINMGDTRYRLLKSKEFAKINLAETMDEAAQVVPYDESTHINKPGEKFQIRYSGFYVCACTEFPVPRLREANDHYEQYKTCSLNNKDDVIIKVEGFYSAKSYTQAIISLKIYSKQGQVINLVLLDEKNEQTNPKADFICKAPEGSYIAAFGGKSLRNELTSFHCWIITDAEKIRIGYEGKKVNNVPHGEGTMVYPDSSRYTGEWKNGKRHGKGVLTNPHGDIIYDGNWLDDIKQGYGTFNYSLTEWYKGYWKNDKRDGEGQYSNPNIGSYYFGSWKNDKLNGFGNFRSTIGYCKGIWENNYCKDAFMEDQFDHFYAGGIMFDPEKKLLFLHGHGVFYKKNTRFGIGDWDYGKGKGKLFSANEYVKWKKYEGELDNLKPAEDTNNATWYFAGGGKLQGNLEDTDQIKCYHSNGVIIERIEDEEEEDEDKDSSKSEDDDSDGARCKLYLGNGSKEAKIKLNAKLVDEYMKDSYYDASSKSLYFMRSPARFHGKRINFLEDKGKSGTWHLIKGEKVVGSWERDDDEKFIFNGTIEYQNGNLFKGTFNLPSSYFTEMREDIELVKGTLTYKNGNKLQATWPEDYQNCNVIEGEGTLFYSNGDKFVGTWEGHVDHCTIAEGKFHISTGKAINYEAEKLVMYQASKQKVIAFGKRGERFELQWDMNQVGGKKEEEEEEAVIMKGICFYLNGDRYEGGLRIEIDDDSIVPHGNGILYYANGDRFEGEWDAEKEKREGWHVISNELVLYEEWDFKWDEDILLACSEETSN